LAKSELAKANVSKILVLALGEAGEDETVGNIHIRYIPPIVNRHEVASYYQASDVYVHASHEDTFPTSILEAMACGLPVVATAVGGIPEQVDNSLTGLLVGPGDSVAMASAIELLLCDSELYKRMATAAAAKSIKQYSRELQSQRYLQWYQDIIAMSPR
jgi:glycosyltransferase involved in cell wall biosynthesis